LFFDQNDRHGVNVEIRMTNVELNLDHPGVEASLGHWTRDALQ
jgi:hypothetical protein